MDEAARTLVSRAFHGTLAILQQNSDILERSAEALLEKETLEESGLREFTGGLRPEPTAHPYPVGSSENAQSSNMPP
jgi:cell division protease FtsH